jgi:hypothetical protein
MIHQWDEFSKSLAEAVPRRESMRRISLALAGVVLGPLGLNNAFATTGDRCSSFCRCRKKSDQNACLTACRACNGATQRLCGSCGSYVCRDLASDFNNCGACGHACRLPGPYENGACVSGKCVYTCIDGAVRCNGVCTFLDSDPKNCGACGNVCGGATPYCAEGVCSVCPFGNTMCDGTCTVLDWDPNNCGACGNVCPDTAPHCSQGVCIACDPGLTWCNLMCVDLNWDNYNCGACNNQCPGGTACDFGICQGSGGGYPYY